MKHLLITIAALVLVGCGPSVPDNDLQEAAGLGNIEAVKQHLAAGVDVNGWGDKGNEATPLYYAAQSGHKEIAELLIANDADVNTMNLDGKTPLDRAIKYKDTETFDLLRKHGAKTGEELKAEGK